jgi:transcriptional regulator with XRE-family HTH domain
LTGPNLTPDWGKRIMNVLMAKGLSRADLAVMLQVNVQTTREWEDGTRTPTQQQMRRLLQVATLLADLHRSRHEDPVAWLETPVEGLPDGHRVRPIDLCWHGLRSGQEGERIGLVLQLANTPPKRRAAVMDAWWPEWPQESYSPYRVVDGPDGQPALVHGPPTTHLA